MLYKIVDSFPDPIIFSEAGPFVSLYQPTHRHSPDNKQDPIKFKNSLWEIEELLQIVAPQAVTRAIMEPLHQIGKDLAFWNKTLDGLVILANQERCVVYRLPVEVYDLLLVGESLHIKPLLSHFQAGNNYHLLGLSRNSFSLYRGSKYGFEPVDIDPAVHLTLEQVVGCEVTESQLGHWSTGGAGRLTMFHGQGGKKDEVEKDVSKYFKYVDRLIIDNYSKNSGLPLILVSTTENQGLFRKISRNNYLMETGIKHSPENMGLDQLKEESWPLIETLYIAKIKDLVDSFAVAKAKSSGSDDLEQVIPAAIQKRIKTVLIEADRVIPGKIDIKTGKVKTGISPRPVYDDILDDIAELVFKNQGEVVVLPKEQMPSATGAAAIYRPKFS